MSKPGQQLRLALLATTLTALCIGTTQAAFLGAGTVTADALRLRGTAATDGDILATASKDATVIVTESASDGWYKVLYNTTEGYMSGEYLNVLSVATMSLGYGEVTTDGSILNLRSTASASGSVLTTVSDGTVLQLDGIADGWFLVTYGGQTGYVSSDYITITDAPATTTTSTSSSAGQAIVDAAMNYIGCKYVYGASGPSSFDCSGFTSYIYKSLGYSIDRTASAQLGNGYSVSKDQLQAGDLVFFKYNTTKAVSHVGIYIGNGQFIHASTNAYKVQLDDLSTGHYANVYVGARRVV